MKKIILLLLFIPGILCAQLKIGSLTTTAISQTGAEKIPISGAGDPATTVANLSAWILGGTIVPVEYNSITDQAATIAAAVSAASAGSTLIFAGSGNIKVETQVTITKRLNFITFSRAKFNTSSGITMIRFASGADDSNIQGFDFGGSGEDSGVTSQIGLSTSGCNRCHAYNLRFFDMGDTGGVFGNPGSFAASIVSNISTKDCNMGIHVTGDYVNLSQVVTNSGNYGFLIDGAGNTEMVNCDATSNDNYGLQLLSAGKFKITGGNFNHNTGPGIDIASLATVNESFRFVNVTSVANGGMNVKNSTANVVLISFVGCFFDSGIAFDASTTLRVIFTGCNFAGSTANTGIKTNVGGADNWKVDGTAYTF